MKRIKVVQLVNALDRGGAETIAVDIARSLNPEVFDSSVWSLQRSKKEKEDLGVRMQGSGKEPIILGEARMSRAIPLLIQRLRKERPDILHCHLPQSIIVGVVAGRLAGVKKIIAHHHNTWEFNSWKINLLLRILKPFIDLHVCYSDTVEKELFGNTHVVKNPVSTRPGHSCTIYNFIDTARIENAQRTVTRAQKRREIGVEEDAFLLLIVARLIPWKGIDTVIRAMPAILARIPSAKLVVVGEGPGRKALEALIEESSAKNSIRLLGSRADTFELLVAADVFPSVYRYEKDAVTKEAVGVAILEAMAAGVPVVVSNYESARKFVREGETGMMVSPDDPAEVARAIVIVKHDTQFAGRISKGAHAFIRERLSKEHMIPIYESIYTTL